MKINKEKKQKAKNARKDIQRLKTKAPIIITPKTAYKRGRKHKKSLDD